MRLEKPLIFCLLACMSGVFYCAPVCFAAQSLSPAEARFYRAVCVLQSFGGEAAKEKVSIPRKVRYADATESLLNHPDRAYALRQATEELNALSQTMPEALLFAAYGNLSLNENERAVNQLTQYVAKTPYKARPYEVLCEALSDMRDFGTLGQVLDEWETKAPGCIESRLIYKFGLLYEEGKYTEARQYLAEMQPCGGWKAQVYAAKATAAMGHGRQAEAEIENVCKAYPEQAQNIQLFWGRIKAREHFF